MVLKDPTMIQHAEELFGSYGVKIISDGHRYLGSTIGNDEFTKKYVKDKVQKWVEDLSDLSEIAVEEPQIALSAYTKGLCHRWSFIQRTIPNIGHLFSPLEECIRETFIPAVIGRKVSDLERLILSFPVRYGGLGISDPTTTCEREYKASKTVTEDLTDAGTLGYPFPQIIYQHGNCNQFHYIL